MAVSPFEVIVVAGAEDDDRLGVQKYNVLTGEMVNYDKATSVSQAIKLVAHILIHRLHRLMTWGEQ